MYTSFFINDEMDVLASSYVGVDGYNSNYYSDEDSNYTYSTSTDTDGDTYSSYYDGEDSGYSQTVNAEGEITDSNYYETGMSLYESILETGLSEVRYNTNDTAGNYQNVVEYKDADGSISRVEYTDQDSGAAQEFFLDAVTDTGTIITSKYLSQSSQDTIIKVQEGSDVSLSYNNQEFFSYTFSSSSN